MQYPMSHATTGADMRNQSEIQVWVLTAIVLVVGKKLCVHVVGF